MKYIRYFLIALTIVVFGALMIRLFMAGDPKESKQFILTEENLSAYEKSPDDFTVIEKTTMNGYLTEDGKFSISQTRYIPSIGEFQATIRYNDSTLENLAEELDTDPDSLVREDGDYFVFVLKDDLGRYYGEYRYITFKKNIYNYCRFVFDGVDMTGVETLWVNIYRVDSVDFSAEPYGALVVYDSNYQSEKYDFAAYIKKNGKELTEGLRFRKIEVPANIEEKISDDSQ